MMKPFRVPQITVKSQSRPSAMSSFIRSSRLSITDRKSRLHSLSTKEISWNDLDQQGH